MLSTEDKAARIITRAWTPDTMARNAPCNFHRAKMWLEIGYWGHPPRVPPPPPRRPHIPLVCGDGGQLSNGQGMENMSTWTPSRSPPGWLSVCLSDTTNTLYSAPPYILKVNVQGHYLFFRRTRLVMSSPSPPCAPMSGVVSGTKV